MKLLHRNVIQQCLWFVDANRKQFQRLVYDPVGENSENSSHAVSHLANMTPISSFADADASAKSLVESVGIPTNYFGTSSEQLKKHTATNEDVARKHALMKASFLYLLILIPQWKQSGKSY